MVDSNLFPQYVNQLIFQSDRILLNTKKCQYTLQISLKNQQCTKITKYHHKNPLQIKQFNAIYGIMQMEINKYLVIVTKSIVIGQIFKKIVFKVQKLQFVCLNHQQSNIDKQYIIGLRSVLQNHSLYYSFQYDLTRSLQKFVQGNCKIEQYRDQYMYNSVWVQQLIKINAEEWITAFISGMVIINFTQLNSLQSSQLTLITRRDKRRQGLRYLTRGANMDGNTANSCQTEIIFSIQQKYHQQYLSYVQIRGSFPFLWNQDPDLQYKPKSKIVADDNINSQITKKFYNYLQQQYGKCTLVNLVDHKGFEKQLGNYLQNIHTLLKMQGMELIWFDFHHQCKGMKYQNIAKLIDQISLNLHDFGYFQLQHTQKSKFVQVKRQTGIIRTNCVDCLDRTNVVQSVIARIMLIKWLNKFKIISQTNNQVVFTKLPRSIQQIFKDQWIQNANILSDLYAGTFAMKTDITRFGKRTFKGALEDARIGTMRYFLGNFYDSRKQDFIHLSLNQIKPKNNQNQKIRHSKINSLHVIGLFAIIIPFIVIGTTNEFMDQEQPKRLSAVGITALTFAVTFKIAQFFSSYIVRKPIPIE